MIPKRPEGHMAGYELEWRLHYEAVAKVAVEALRDTPCQRASSRRCSESPNRWMDCARCEALAASEQSGWKPE